MTYKEKKSKIADILMDFQEEYSNDVINRPMLASLYAGNILSFIDSMQKEPVNEDLEESADEFVKSYIRGGTKQSWLKEGYIVGAQWQKEQLIKQAIDGIARPDDNEIWCDLKSFNFKDGDKIKVIVIKKD